LALHQRVTDRRSDRRSDRQIYDS